MILLKSAALFREKVFDRFYPTRQGLPGYSFGMDKLEQIRFEKSQTSLWTGYNGHGKSLFLNQLMLSAIADHQERFIVASLEMLPDRNLVRTARQVLHKVCPPREEIDHCLDWCGDSIQFYDYVGRADMLKMLDNFKYGVVELGVTSIVIDSLMKMGLAEDDYSKQKLFIEDMANFALEFNVHVHIVAHSRKQIDESKVPGKMDVMGAGGITNIPDNGFSVWRNKAKEAHMFDCFSAGISPDPQKCNQHDALLECWKCRDNGENEKTYALWYDTPSMQYLEKQGYRPKEFVKVINEPF